MAFTNAEKDRSLYLATLRHLNRDLVDRVTSGDVPIPSGFSDRGALKPSDLGANGRSAVFRIWGIAIWRDRAPASGYLGMGVRTKLEFHRSGSAMGGSIEVGARLGSLAAAMVGSLVLRCIGNSPRLAPRSSAAPMAGCDDGNLVRHGFCIDRRAIGSVGCGGRQKTCLYLHRCWTRDERAR